MTFSKIILLSSFLGTAFAADKILVATGHYSETDVELAPMPNSQSALTCRKPPELPLPHGGLGWGHGEWATSDLRGARA